MFKNIAFDIDGCLQMHQEYILGRFLTEYKEETGRDYSGQIKLDEYDMRDAFPDDDTGLYDRRHDDWFNDYVRNTPIDPHAKDLFILLKRLGVRVHIVTARVNSMNRNFTDVESLTKAKLGAEGIYPDEYHFGEDKVSIIKGSGIELIVEDQPENIILLSESIPVMVRDQRYNKLVAGSNMYRIYSLYPKAFVEKLKYIETHRNYLGRKEKVQDERALDISYVGGVFYINQGQIMSSKKPLFLLSITGSNISGMVEKWGWYLKKSKVFDLREIDNPDTKDPIIKAALAVHNKKHVDIRHTSEAMSSDVYQIRRAVINQILDSASSYKEGRAIIAGAQWLELPREDRMKFKDHPMILHHLSDSQKEIAMGCIYKEDYNEIILLEDMNEISMDTRKLSIIASTDSKHLKNYINREFYTADGIDTVQLAEGETPYHPESFAGAIDMDTFVIGDCHISTNDKAKTEVIIENINKTVGIDDTLLFLGDFDGKGGSSLEEVKRFMSKINCKKKYLLLGNNDGYSIQDYVDCGFIGIKDIHEMNDGSRNIIISHCPTLVSGSNVNIHGHLHGGRSYWNMDAEGHIDIWNEDFIPYRIREYLEMLDRNFYRATTEHVSFI